MDIVQDRFAWLGESETWRITGEDNRSFELEGRVRDKG